MWMMCRSCLVVTFLLAGCVGEIDGVIEGPAQGGLDAGVTPLADATPRPDGAAPTPTGIAPAGAVPDDRVAAAPGRP
jgi:hypothetical protein